MHELRSAIVSGNGRSEATPVASKESCRRQHVAAGRSLVDIVIPRDERRVTNQRREDRYRGIVETATIVFRRKKASVKVVNVSESGVMIEADIVPRIGESIAIEFEGFERLDGVVCWVKQGRVGVDVGDGSIALG